MLFMSVLFTKENQMEKNLFSNHRQTILFIAAYTYTLYLNFFVLYLEKDSGNKQMYTF